MRYRLVAILFFISFNTLAQIQGPYSDGLAWIKKKSKYGFINDKKEFVIPIVFDSTYSFREGVTPVKFNGKWFYITKEGKCAHQSEAFQYSRGRTTENNTDKDTLFFKVARPYFNKRAIIEYLDDVDTTKGVYRIYQEGQFIIHHDGWTMDFTDYEADDSVGNFDKGYAIAKKNGKYGIIDTNYNYLLPKIYDRIISYNKGYATVVLNGREIRLNPFGECVWNCTEDLKLPRRSNGNFSTIYFNHLGSKFDKKEEVKLENLLRYLKKERNIRIVITGMCELYSYGTSEGWYNIYASIQKSWDNAYAVQKFLVNNDIKRERIIFQYGRQNGPSNTVSIRDAMKGEEGPSLTPPPFPNHAR